MVTSIRQERQTGASEKNTRRTALGAVFAGTTRPTCLLSGLMTSGYLRGTFRPNQRAAGLAKLTKVGRGARAIFSGKNPGPQLPTARTKLPTCVSGSASTVPPTGGMARMQTYDALTASILRGMMRSPNDKGTAARFAAKRRVR